MQNICNYKTKVMCFCTFVYLMVGVLPGKPVSCSSNNLKPGRAKSLCTKNLIFPELILMFKSLGNFAFKLNACSVQQRKSCVFQAEYWNMLLDINLLNLLNLVDLAGLLER